MAPKLKQCEHKRVQFVVYRSGRHRDIQSTCQECGKEWTISETVEDLNETVTSSEQIELHRLLDSDKSLKDLLSDR